MIWKTLGCEFKVMDDMNDSMSWAQGTKCYEQLMFIIDMNDSESWAQGSRCYQLLKLVDDMSYSAS